MTPTAMTLLHVVPYADAAEAYEYRLYLVTEWEGTPENRLPEEHAEIRWLSPDELECLPVAHPAYIHLFRQALGNAQS